ncbi:hypothetical protein BSZ19_04835 [Bradyrhizobium japonicum]|uniref:Uncharacterized protein n=1 Tax=Bradyrhizobium japonicum TaxID=375 RepID=A0A1Y2JXI1_BRAJP|nr:hypothetical protein [Bradyrhizobium japonicum]OSJ36310.1 hypothetical protein BSZ19_04835 [Bradyrhizobium japonicum]
MINKPTSREIEDVIYHIQATRDRWQGNAGYARCLDIELHALRLLLFTTRIVEEEVDIAAHLGMGGTADA